MLCFASIGLNVEETKGNKNSCVERGDVKNPSTSVDLILGFFLAKHAHNRALARSVLVPRLTGNIVVSIYPARRDFISLLLECVYLCNIADDDKKKSLKASRRILLGERQLPIISNY